MTPALNVQNAYRDTAQTIRTDRSIEYDAFARITRRLKQTQTGNQNISSLAQAIHDNRKLWSVLACDVADDNNPLPEGLRTRILYLAEFTRQHSQSVLRSGISVDPLIEINTAIMRGLRNMGETA